MYMYDFCMIQRTLSAVEIFTFEICHSISLRKKGGLCQIRYTTILVLLWKHLVTFHSLHATRFF